MAGRSLSNWWRRLWGHRPAPAPLAGRRRFLRAGAAVAYGGTLWALGKLWYEQPSEEFHWFDDNAQWQQMDKVGHAYSAFQLSRLAQGLAQWAGVPPASALAQAPVWGWAALAPIEWLDGRQPGYGASPGDLLANTLGAVLYFAQARWLPAADLQARFAFWPSTLATARPERLGRHLGERLIKDYNGQTYWLSVGGNWLLRPWRNPEDAEPEKPTPWRLAIGYGAGGLVYGQPQQNLAQGYGAFRRFFVGVDLDWAYVQQSLGLTGPGWQAAFFAAQAYRCPAPALLWATGLGRGAGLWVG
ncbi:MAG: YfiM family protein [Bernardetiaceae bacterium]|nr:YfiM family protein [Bernardetiaceae bacterium]